MRRTNYPIEVTVRTSISYFLTGRSYQICSILPLQPSWESSLFALQVSSQIQTPPSFKSSSVDLPRLYYGNHHRSIRYTIRQVLRPPGWQKRAHLLTRNSAAKLYYKVRCNFNRFIRRKIVAAPGDVIIRVEWHDSQAAYPSGTSVYSGEYDEYKHD